MEEVQLKEVFIKRFYGDDKQTLGSLTYFDKETKSSFLAKTLELAWNENKNNESCIPADRYLCKWTRSNRLSKLAGHDVYTYEITKVKDRAGIRMHAANFFNQLLGCISLGSSHKDINADQNLDVIHSGDTIKKFNELMNKEDFILDIRWEKI